MVDVTSVDLGDDGNLEQTPTLTWQAFTEDGSGLISHQLAIGTTVGGEEFQEWTSLGDVVTYQVADTELEDGTTYYASIRALDAARNIILVFN